MTYLDGSNGETELFILGVYFIRRPVALEDLTFPALMPSLWA